MSAFGWIGDLPVPPSRWDLRLRGWKLCHHRALQTPAGAYPLLVDASSFGDKQALGRLDPEGHFAMMLLLGVDDGTERAALLARGCAEALPSAISLLELEERARRVARSTAMLPRTRRIGPLVLDLFHRDARSGPRWLSLHPREFGLLWRLADQPGQRVTRRQLLQDVWRIQHEPETNSVEVHVSRLRSKLAGAGCDSLIETASEGGYRLTAKPVMSYPADPLSKPPRAPIRAGGLPAQR